MPGTAQRTVTTAAPPRSRQAERSARMRARLAHAAYEVIRDGGYVNFRTAAVSQAAGVSQGAQLHHYPTKRSLAHAAIEHAWEQATAASLARIEAYAPGGDIVGAIIEDASDFFFSEYFTVALDILMAGGRDESVRDDLVQSTLKHRQRVERLWLEKLVADGWPLADAEDVLALTMSLVRGFAVRSLVEPGRERFEALATRWRAIILAAGLAPEQPSP